MDVHTAEKRSYNMSRIKSMNTTPEIMVRKWLWANGYYYRLHRICLPGKPDIIFPGRRKVLYVHGCFWHKHSCKYFKWPQTNSGFWKNKIDGNVRRDYKNYEALIKLGWSYFVIWECESKNMENKLLRERLITFIEKSLSSEKGIRESK